MVAELDQVKQKLADAGQEHLLRFWSDLDLSSQQDLINQIDTIDLPAINTYYQRIQENEKSDDKVDDHLEPLEPEVCGSVVRSTEEELSMYRDIGLEKIANGEVAVLLLAGGQGTRLGSEKPKGMFNVHLPSRKCMYQIQGERLVRIQQVANKQYSKMGCVPWYIMTSEATKDKTREYFERKHYFGLKSENVKFFEQGTLPCLTFDGKIIMESKGRVATAPDGNGGLYRALGEGGIIEDMTARGIKYIHVYCVDNILIKMADPVFIGFCITKNAQCGNKVVEKTSPTEAVGVVGKVSGRYQVVEYSEITLKTAQLRSPDGRLKYNAGNICNHYFTLDFLTDVVRNHDSELTHHVAKKKIPYINDDGECIKPTKPNGIKMEKFVFDVFRFADNVSPVIDESRRKPVFPEADGHNGTTNGTNTNGKTEHKSSSSDSGDSGTEEEIKKCLVVEISPLVSYAGEGLSELVNEKIFSSPLIIASDKESVGKSRIRKPSFVVDHC